MYGGRNGLQRWAMSEQIALSSGRAVRSLPGAVHFLHKMPKAFRVRLGGFAGEFPPAEKTGFGIVWVPYVRFYPLVHGTSPMTADLDIYRAATRKGGQASTHLSE